MWQLDPIYIYVINNTHFIFNRLGKLYVSVVFYCHTAFTQNQLFSSTVSLSCEFSKR